MAIELLHRKESIILTVIDIINELGIQGFSTRELARRQGISEGTLFRHFKSKTHILLDVLDYFSKYDADIFHSIRLKELKARDAMVFFVDSYATYYENDPAITVMTQIYSVLSYEAELAPRINRILDDRKNFMKEIIEAGQRAGEFRSDRDSGMLADIISGSCHAICLTWRKNDQSFSLRKQTLEALDIVLDALKPFHQEKINERNGSSAANMRMEGNCE